MNPPLVGDGPSQGGVLITGGAGYIGAHTAKAVSQTGRRVVVFDNFSHGFRQACQWGGVVEGDIRDRAALTAAMHEHEIGAVINFAGLIEVGRSVTDPDLFWDYNVTGLLNVLSAMRHCGVPHLVFSSSAAVYGQNPTASFWAMEISRSPPRRFQR